MAMNTSKVLVGGIAAGIVLNVIDWVTYTYVVADRVKAEAEAFKSGLGSAMMAGNAITVYVITDLVVGILLVWTYAAIRPRFGPGPKTAAAAAILFWIFGSFLNASHILMGMTSIGLWWTTGIIWLISLLLAAWVGAKIYTEEAAPAAA
jgi:hypothetical protein